LNQSDNKKNEAIFQQKITYILNSINKFKNKKQTYSLKRGKTRYRWLSDFYVLPK
jgi:hypothetical protein